MTSLYLYRFSTPDISLVTECCDINIIVIQPSDLILQNKYRNSKDKVKKEILIMLG